MALLQWLYFKWQHWLPMVAFFLRRYNTTHTLKTKFSPTFTIMGCHWIRSTLKPLENCRMVSWVVHSFCIQSNCTGIFDSIFFFFSYIALCISIIHPFGRKYSFCTPHYHHNRLTMPVLKSENSSIYTKHITPIYNHFDAQLKAFKNFSSAAHF